MSNNNAKLGPDCSQYRPSKEYTHLQEMAHNLPYLLMGLCGSAILLVGLGPSVSGWTAAAAYFGYCVAGAVWIMVFVCPHCQYYETRACPCGYGQIAARFVPKSSENRFAEQFRRHIPVIVPLWLIPPIAGVAFLVRHYDLSLLILLLVFVVDAFILLPLVSRLYSCGHCPQSHDCPWMIRKESPGA